MAQALPSYTSDFERFWRAYPRRRPNPRPEACQEWHKALKVDGIDAEMLIEAAGRFAEECRREKLEPVFIPHARTWLHRRRFLDYLSGPLEPGAAPKDGQEPEGACGAGVGGSPRLRPLAERLSRTAYETWIAPLELCDEAGGGVRVVAPTPLHRDWVRNHYGDLVRSALGVQPSWYTVPYNRARGPDSDGESDG